MIREEQWLREALLINMTDKGFGLHLGTCSCTFEMAFEMASERTGGFLYVRVQSYGVPTTSRSFLYEVLSLERFRSVALHQLWKKTFDI